MNFILPEFPRCFLGEANSTTIGTCGTPFMNYLYKHKEDCEKFFI